MILRIVCDVNRLQLFHIRICFLFLTTHILRNKSISRQNSCNWYTSHSTITVPFNTVSVTVLQGTVIVVLSTSAGSRSVTAVSDLSLLIIILLIGGITVNFIIFSQYIHLFDLRILNSSFLAIEIVIYISVTIR